MHLFSQWFLGYVEYGKQYTLLPTLWGKKNRTFGHLMFLFILSSWIHFLDAVRYNDVSFRDGLPGVGMVSEREEGSEGGGLLRNMDGDL